MQIILTYIIVAVALFFAGRGIWRLFRSARKKGGCGDCCGCGTTAARKKPFVFNDGKLTREEEKK